MKKKVLFIGPVFYHYHKEVIRAIEEYINADVVFIPERQYDLFHEIIKYSAKYILKSYSNSFLFRRIKKVDVLEDYNYIFLIRGELISKKIISYLRNKCYKARFIYYQWDSFAENPNAKNIYRLFDSTFSFDRNDCNNYKELRYLPLFYSKTKGKRKEKIDEDIDILFFGSDHSDRYKITREVENKANTLGLKIKILLRTTHYSYFRKKYFSFNSNYVGIKKKFFVFNKIEFKEIENLISRSKAILDINNVIQSGLTIRTFEILSNNKKLITTNSNIKYEDFFHPNNIYIIDRKNIQLNTDFFKVDFFKISLNKYEIGNWVKTLFFSNYEYNNIY